MNLAVSTLLGTVALGKVYYKDDFTSLDHWTEVSDKKGLFELGTEEWGLDTESTRLKTGKDAKFYGITTKLDEPMDNTDKPLVVQLAVKHEQRIDCGGGYIKLISSLPEPEKFNGDTEYEIMFGPDICGATKRVHAILSNGGENLLINKEIRCPADEYTHFYTFELNPDGTFDVLVDGESKQKGDVKEFWDFEKPKEINDPDQSKPDTWVDDPMMDDPEDAKPEDWDQAEQIVDPEAEKPDDWDDEDDGEWEAPMVPNPDYKGEWHAKRIENPDFKGAWKHPKIPNPEWVEVKDPQKRAPINFIAFDLWQVKSGTLFSGLMITDNAEEAKAARWTSEKHQEEKDAKTAFDTVQEPPEEEEEEDEEEASDLDEEEDMAELDEEEDAEQESVGHDEL